MFSIITITASGQYVQQINHMFSLQQLYKRPFTQAIRGPFLLNILMAKKGKSKAGKRKAEDKSVQGNDVSKNVKVEDEKLKDALKDFSESGDSKGSTEKVESVDSYPLRENTEAGRKFNHRIISWNVAGLRALIKKNAHKWLLDYDADIICLQETKCDKQKLPPEIKDISGYHAYWNEGEKAGQNGVALLSKVEPKSIKFGIEGKEEHNKEGRTITAEYDNFYLVTSYVPNSGRGLKRLDYRQEWDKDFRQYLKKLDEVKPVILCGDLNVSHLEIDLKNPKSNKKNAGFTQEERDGFSELLATGFIDSFRQLYPERTGAYSFWTYMGNARSKNVGWRLDYFVLSEKLKKDLCDSIMHPEVLGSDHCPVSLYMSFPEKEQ